MARRSVHWTFWLSTISPPTHYSCTGCPHLTPSNRDIECPPRAAFLLPQYRVRERRYRNICNTAPEVLEGLLVAALLYLDGTRKEPSRLLSSAFPNASGVRRLPLSLHADIMVNPVYTIEKAVAIVSPLVDRVRHHFYGSSMTSLDQLIHPIIRPRVYSLFLPEAIGHSSDSDAILRVIVEIPESSSWHRQILTKEISPARFRLRMWSNY